MAVYKSDTRPRRAGESMRLKSRDDISQVFLKPWLRPKCELANGRMQAIGADQEIEPALTFSSTRTQSGCSSSETISSLKIPSIRPLIFVNNNRDRSASWSVPSDPTGCH